MGLVFLPSFCRGNIAQPKALNIGVDIYSIAHSLQVKCRRESALKKESDPTITMLASPWN